LLLALLLSLAALTMGATRDGPVVVPDNAFSNGYSFGAGWNCSYGFKQEGDECVAMEVPENGFINASGTGLKCERGYRVEGFLGNKTCGKIEVPADGYLTESNSNSGWACNRGFNATNDSCDKILIPDNAFLSTSSRTAGWECERGYQAVGNACIAIDVPDNAYLQPRTYGNSWQCQRGYAQDRDTGCIKFEVPEFAHLDSTGNAWECNRPYKKRGDTCVMP